MLAVDTARSDPLPAAVAPLLPPPGVRPPPGVEPSETAPSLPACERRRTAWPRLRAWICAAASLRRSSLQPLWLCASRHAAKARRSACREGEGEGDEHHREGQKHLKPAGGAAQRLQPRLAHLVVAAVLELLERRQHLRGEAEGGKEGDNHLRTTT